MPATVIIGAGIIGTSTAFWLSESSQTEPSDIHIVEASSELFYCASGLAGGFMAADWFAPSVAPLGRLSFELHKKVAEKYNGKERWGYSPSTSTSLSYDNDVVVGSGEDWLHNDTSRSNAAVETLAEAESHPAWLSKPEGASIEVISRDGSTAQVNPLNLCRFMLDECLARGVQLHHPARCVSIKKDSEGRLSGVKIRTADGTKTEIPCARLVITAGAWSPNVFSELFPTSKSRIPITSLGGHSLLVRTPRWTSDQGDSGCHAIFATDTLGFSPEIFSRRGGEVYIAGLNTATLELPGLATDVRAKEQSIEQLKKVAKSMLEFPGDPNRLEVIRESLCFRPVTNNGRPIISRVADSKLGGITTLGGSQGGVFVAGGHGAWGISQSLGTGLVLSEIIEGKPTSANVKALGLP